MNSRFFLEASQPRGPAAPRRPTPKEEPPLRTFTSEELFAGATEICIRHDGAQYRLKITRQGKLILNK